MNHSGQRFMATQRPKPCPRFRSKPSSSERWCQKSTKNEIERCNQLRNWYINHSGKRPRQSSDDKTEASLALWLKRALMRRTRAVNNRPCLRQLTTKETARLNSINFIARYLNPVPEDTGSTALPDDFERCSELRQWYKATTTAMWVGSKALARWLDKARLRRARTHHNNPSGRKLTASETATQRSKTQRPKPPTSKRGRQKSTKDSKTRSSLAQPQILQGDTTVSANSVEDKSLIRTSSFLKH